MKIDRQYYKVRLPARNNAGNREFPHQFAQRFRFQKVVCFRHAQSMTPFRLEKTKKSASPARTYAFLLLGCLLYHRARGIFKGCPESIFTSAAPTLSDGNPGSRGGMGFKKLGRAPLPACANRMPSLPFDPDTPFGLMRRSAQTVAACVTFGSDSCQHRCRYTA
jgi:hypothetical protein